jgi:hypothetical protein
MLIYAMFTEAHNKGEDVARFVVPYDSAYLEFQRQEALLETAIIAKIRKLMPPPRKTAFGSGF